MALIKRSKYRVRQDAVGRAARTVDGILFASQREARRYVVLKQLQRTGQISMLEIQPKFDLRVWLGGLEVKGCGIVGKYVGDFRYLDKSGAVVIEDCKGVRTETYRLKKKIVEANYNIKITEV